MATLEEAPRRCDAATLRRCGEPSPDAAMLRRGEEHPPDAATLRRCEEPPPTLRRCEAARLRGCDALESSRVFSRLPASSRLLASS
eukprot:9262990-Alexandrium_andersonii.AAC.1